MIIYAGESVLEVNRDPIGEAGRDPQHPSLTAAAGQAAGVESGDGGWPVNDGHPWAVGVSGSGGEKLAGEVGSVQPGLRDEQLGSGFEAVDALGVSAERTGQRCGCHAGSLAAVARPAMPGKAGMPRLTAALRRTMSPSSWASLAFAAARLTFSPSASPAQPCCRASSMRAIRLSRIPDSRGR